MNENGEVDFVRPVGFTPAFQHNVGWDNTIKLFDSTDPQIGANTGEYQGESSGHTFPKIPPSLVGNAVGKAVRFRRVSDSTESPNGLTVARSNPWSLTSVPPGYMDNTHGKLFDTCLSQILPLVTKHTLFLGTIFGPLLQAPWFSHTLGALGPKPHAD